MLAPNMVSKYFSGAVCSLFFSAGHKDHFFREPVNNHQNIIISKGFRHLGEVHSDVLLGTGRCREGKEQSGGLLVGYLRLLAHLAVLDVGLDLLFHPIPYVVLSKPIVCSLDTLMCGNRCVMKVHNKQMVLLISPISDINQLNSYRIQEYLILIIVA